MKPGVVWVQVIPREKRLHRRHKFLVYEWRVRAWSVVVDVNTYLFLARSRLVTSIEPELQAAVTGVIIPSSALMLSEYTLRDRYLSTPAGQEQWRVILFHSDQYWGHYGHFEQRE